MFGTLFQTIEFGLPAGWAAWDHSWKNGLRTNQQPSRSRSDSAGRLGVARGRPDSQCVDA
jgi:hypothetical protein